MTKPSDDRELKARSRWPAGPQVSRGTLIGNGAFLAIFVALAFVMESFFILYLLLAIIAVVVAIRLIRGKSLIPLLQQGTDYRDNYRVEGRQVTVDRDGETWTEPLSGYEGVLWRSQRVRRGNLASRRHRHSDLFHIVELHHASDRTRDVNIYTSQERAGMRARWEAAAEAFGLPALREMEDGTIRRREAEDVGRSLRELAGSGRLDAGFNRSGKVPRGASWQEMGDRLELRLARAALPQVLIALPLLLFALFVGFMVPADPWNTALVIAAPTLVYGLWVIVACRLRIDGGEIVLDWRLGPLTLWRRRMALEDVAEVITASSLVAWSAVQIESHRKTLRIAPLAEDQADWAARFLRAAIAGAPAGA